MKITIDIDEKDISRLFPNSSEQIRCRGARGNPDLSEVVAIITQHGKGLNRTSEVLCPRLQEYTGGKRCYEGDPAQYKGSSDDQQDECLDCPYLNPI